MLSGLLSLYSILCHVFFFFSPCLFVLLSYPVCINFLWKRMCCQKGMTENRERLLILCGTIEYLHTIQWSGRSENEFTPIFRTVQCPGAGLSDWIVLSVHTVCIKSVCVCVCLQKKSLGSVLYRAGFAVSVSANIAFILTQSSSVMPSSAFVFVNHHTSATTVSLIIIPRWKQALDETPPPPDPFSTCIILHWWQTLLQPACLFDTLTKRETHSVGCSDGESQTSVVSLYLRV